MGYIQNLLGRNERIAFVTRQHWIVLLGPLLVNAFLLAAIVAPRIWPRLVAAGGPSSHLAVAIVAL